MEEKRDTVNSASAKSLKSGGFIVAVVSAAAVLLCVALSLSALIVSLSFARRNKAGDAFDYAGVYASVRPSCVELYGPGTRASGVVYKIANGNTYIITNYHAIYGASGLEARFVDFGDRIGTVLLGYDEYHDIALLEAEGKHGAPVTGGGIPRAGDRVLAVGNNLGYGIAAFDGIASKVNRMLAINGKAVPVYAVTSPVNAGMSGGGLFDGKGRILGINTYQTHSTGSGADERYVDGVSYSVPYNIAEKVAQQIYREKSGTQINKLVVSGVTDGGSALSSQIEFAALYFTASMTQGGFKVVSTAEDHLSECIGGKVQTGDTVVRIGGLKIGYGTNFCEIFSECLKYIADTDLDTDQLEVEVKRGNETVTVKYGTKRLKNY